MEILMDTREQDALTFQMVHGVTVKSEYLKVGDYGARHEDGEMDNAAVERKSLADLFGSFTGDNYRREKEKVARAKELGLRYILAVEANVSEVLKGYQYWDGNEMRESKKSGISQVRQIMTLLRRGDFVEVWWCRNRTEMAFMIQEYFLAQKRLKEKK